MNKQLLHTYFKKTQFLTNLFNIFQGFELVYYDSTSSALHLIPLGLHTGGLWVSKVSEICRDLVSSEVFSLQWLVIF